jgi:hypothetical protein
MSTAASDAENSRLNSTGLWNTRVVTSMTLLDAHSKRLLLSRYRSLAVAFKRGECCVTDSKSIELQFLLGSGLRVSLIPPLLQRLRNNLPGAPRSDAGDQKPGYARLDIW